MDVIKAMGSERESALIICDLISGIANPLFCNLRPLFQVCCSLHGRSLYLLVFTFDLVPHIISWPAAQTESDRLRKTAKTA
jgi:hypothetical protein